MAALTGDMEQLEAPLSGTGFSLFPENLQREVLSSIALSFH